MGAYLPKAAAASPQRLEEVFALLPKLPDRQAQIASTLSGGERRMVGIGRGLMADARLLMLDEPSLGLAPIVIDQIYEVIRTLTKAGRTILVVEENALRIADVADRMHLLDNGNCVWSGTGRGVPVLDSKSFRLTWGADPRRHSPAPCLLACRRRSPQSAAAADVPA